MREGLRERVLSRGLRPKLVVHGFGTTAVVVVDVPTGDDDAEWRGLPYDDGWITTGNSITVGRSTYDYSGAFRFIGIAIPQGANIASAALAVTEWSTWPTTTVGLSIRAEDSDNPAMPTSGADARARARTTATVHWAIEAGWLDGASYESPDFKDVIQEIVDRPGWVSGNAILLFLENEAPSFFSREISAKNYAPYTPPRLTVVYS